MHELLHELIFRLLFLQWHKADKKEGSLLALLWYHKYYRNFKITRTALKSFGNLLRKYSNNNIGIEVITFSIVLEASLILPLEPPVEKDV